MEGQKGWKFVSRPMIRATMERQMNPLTDGRCVTCYGTGQLVEARPVRFGQPLQLPEQCPDCNGTGIQPKRLLRPVPIKSRMGSVRRARRG